MTKAAVVMENGTSLEIVDLEVDSPRAGEVKVQIKATGVCHSDLAIQGGTSPFPYPMVAGHEAAGIVEDVGKGVKDFRPGDHVIICCVPQCGTCFFCKRGQPELCEVAMVGVVSGGLLDGTPRFRLGGQPVYQFCCTGTFAESTVVPATGLVKIDPDVRLSAAALISCAVATGVGSVRNNADVQDGDTVVVIGCGGVGLNVIQGARIKGAAMIVAIDVVSSKLELASKFGATHSINAATGDAVAEVLSLTAGRGADAVFEAIGHPTTVAQTVDMTRRGGQAVFIGAAPPGTMVNIGIHDLMGGEKRITGTAYGATNIRRDIPDLVNLYTSGQLLLDEIVSAEIPLEDVNLAFDRMREGTIARSVIVF